MKRKVITILIACLIIAGLGDFSKSNLNSLADEKPPIVEIITYL